MFYANFSERGKKRSKQGKVNRNPIISTFNGRKKSEIVVLFAMRFCGTHTFQFNALFFYLYKFLFIFAKYMHDVSDDGSSKIKVKSNNTNKTKLHTAKM